MLKTIFSLFKEQPKKKSNNTFRYDNKTGIVDEFIYPGRKGYIYSNGIWWKAQCTEDIILEPGMIVDIVGIENLTMWVKPSLKAFYTINSIN